MKKKIVLFAAALIAALALTGMITFALSGEMAGEPRAIALEGTWLLVSKTQGGKAALPEDQYIVFEGEQARLMSGSDTQFSGSYSLMAKPASTDWTLRLPQKDRTYTLRPLTENCIRLSEDKVNGMYLVRCVTAEAERPTFGEEMLAGRWDVAYRNTGDAVLREQLVFENGELRDYRNGADTPAITAGYALEKGNRLTVSALGMEAICLPMTQDLLFFVETATGYVWELHKTEQ